MKKLIFMLAFMALTGCESEKDILCESPVITEGNLVVVNRQCIYLGSHTISFIELEDTRTKQHYTYSMNLIDRKIVLNQNTPQVIPDTKSSEIRTSTLRSLKTYKTTYFGRSVMTLA